MSSLLKFKSQLNKDIKKAPQKAYASCRDEQCRGTTQFKVEKPTFTHSHNAGMRL
jgi:hypothetical protein